MKILLVTAGERVSASGLYRSQIINIALEFAQTSSTVSVLSFVPIMNPDSLSKGVGYWSYIRNIVAFCGISDVALRVFYLPYSSHAQFIGKRVYLFLWDNPIVLGLIRVCLTRIGPDIISCRGLLSAYLVCKALRNANKTFINYDIRGNSSVEACLLYAASLRQRERIKGLEQYVLALCDSVTTVSQVLAHQCNVPAHKCHITRIASSMPLGGKDKPSFNPDEGHTYFLTIGSISKSWYPLSEFAQVSTGINSSLPNSANIVLAPQSCHSAISNYSYHHCLRISKLESFSSEVKAAEYASGCLFGLLPYRQPQEREDDLAELAATVMSTKLSDYLLLGIIPIVPQWCIAAAEFVASHHIGFVYDSRYSFSFLRDPDLPDIIKSYQSNIHRVRQAFTARSIASEQLRHFSKYL
jgi:hypothetical protein